MSGPTVSELEARLNAQRKLIVHMVYHLARHSPDDGFLDAVMRDSDILDQEEDPGIEPTEAFAQQAAMAAEVRAIIDIVQARLDASDDRV